MKAEELEHIKNVPVHQWLPAETLPQEVLEMLELEFLVDRRYHKLVSTWSPRDRGFVDVKHFVNDFRLRHRILEVYDKFYICTQSPRPTSIYAFYCGRCVSAGDRDEILAEVEIQGLGHVKQAIEEVKSEVARIAAIKKTRKIRLY